MPAKTKIRLYVVQRFDWEYSDEYHFRCGDGEPLKAFRDRAKAESYRLGLEREMRERYNPFDVNGVDLEDQTSLTAPELCRRLREAGIDPPVQPKRGRPDFCGWWYDVERKLTAEQKDLVWDLLDLARFYDITETETEVET